MTERTILQLGDPRLYEASSPVRREELAELAPVIRDLHDTMRAFQARYGWGRAIAAPQIGVAKRIVCMNDGEARTLINPSIDDASAERMTHWEDCMSFPDLVVQLSNPRSCRLRYYDEEWQQHSVRLSEDYAELLQHEVDHLDGVLAVQRALDDRSFALRATRGPKDLRLRGSREVLN